MAKHAEKLRHPNKSLPARLLPNEWQADLPTLIFFNARPLNPIHPLSSSPEPVPAGLPQGWTSLRPGSVEDFTDIYPWLERGRQAGPTLGNTSLYADAAVL